MFAGEGESSRAAACYKCFEALRLKNSPHFEFEEDDGDSSEVRGVHHRLEDHWLESMHQQSE